ncbi:hypothetical protein TNCV_478981 [Trichonephila clavipes]|nr:hypothetical protein TNCV_478981 [Trichonephila clavipes]
MIQKFETTEQFDILLGRGGKEIPSSSVKNVATAVVEASSQSLDGGVRVSVASCVLNMSYSALQQILPKI